jgi:hypothetical protein
MDLLIFLDEFTLSHLYCAAFILMFKQNSFEISFIKISFFAQVFAFKCSMIKYSIAIIGKIRDMRLISHFAACFFIEASNILQGNQILLLLKNCF